MITVTMFIFRFVLGNGKNVDVKAENEIEATQKMIESNDNDEQQVYSHEHGFARWTMVGVVGFDTVTLLWVLGYIPLWI